MRNATTLALAFIALSGFAATTAGAQDRGGRGEGPQKRFERMDADSSGDVSFEEFKSMFQNRLDVAAADADSDGKLTVGEIADQIQRRRAERQARRLIERFDADGDGALTTAEIERHQQKRFALMDRNDDGKISEDEMPRRMRGDRRR